MADPKKVLALKKPCSNCPFLKEGAIELRPGRVEGIIADMVGNDFVSFPCHKTTHKAAESSACYGAMTYLLKARRPNVATRMGAAMGMVDLDAMRNQFDKIIEVVDVTKKLP